MRSNEIRVGNFIYHHEHLVEVTAIGKDSVSYEPVDESIGGSISDCDGVPIIDGWLLKLGFKKHKVVVGGTYNFILGDFRINSALPTCLLYGNEYDHLNISVVYVHELQNIYYSLTGKELIADAATKNKITHKIAKEIAGEAFDCMTKHISSVLNKDGMAFEKEFEEELHDRSILANKSAIKEIAVQYDVLRKAVIKSLRIK